MTGTAVTLYEENPDARLGPAMEALNHNQRQFVLAIIQTGCTNTKAAELAGYKGDRNTLKANGWRLAHDARIQAAIQEEAQKLIRSTSVMAINVIADIARDKRVPARDRIKAAVELLNRGGLPAQSEHLLTVEHHDRRTTSELIESIAGMCRDFGIEPLAVLERVGVHAEPTDAVFELITGPADAAPAPVARNLTDPSLTEDWTVFPERTPDV